MLKKIARPPNAMRHILTLFGVWQQRVRSRSQLRQLSRMDDHVLKDIGLTRNEVLFEASRPFWR